MSRDAATRTGDETDWKFQLRDALWLQSSAPLNPRSIACEARSYLLAASCAALLVLIVAGFGADWLLTSFMLLFVLTDLAHSYLSYRSARYFELTMESQFRKRAEAIEVMAHVSPRDPAIAEQVRKQEHDLARSRRAFNGELVVLRHRRINRTGWLVFLIAMQIGAVAGALWKLGDSRAPSTAKE